MLLDTSAWIELFIRSNKGKKMGYIVGNEKCYTSIVSLAEISNWALKQNLDPSGLKEIVTGLAEILDIDIDLAILAGELNYKMKKTVKDFGMIDSIILATARVYDMKIVTTDRHFKDLENVIML